MNLERQCGVLRNARISIQRDNPFILTGIVEKHGHAQGSAYMWTENKFSPPMSFLN